MDESAAPKFRTAYFFEVAHHDSGTTIRGLIHRDDQRTLEALLDIAAELGAEGKVLLENARHRDAGIRIEVANGKRSTREENVKSRLEGDRARKSLASPASRSWGREALCSGQGEPEGEDELEGEGEATVEHET